MVSGAQTGPAFEINMAFATAATALQCLGAPAAAAKTGAVRIERTDQVLGDGEGQPLVATRTCRMAVSKKVKEAHKINGLDGVDYLLNLKHATTMNVKMAAAMR
jgi:hypothetical protein